MTEPDHQQSTPLVSEEHEEKISRWVVLLFFLVAFIMTIALAQTFLSGKLAHFSASKSGGVSSTTTF